MKEHTLCPNRWVIEIRGLPLTEQVRPDQVLDVEWGRLYMKVPVWAEYHKGTIEAWELDALYIQVSSFPGWAREDGYPYEISKEWLDRGQNVGTLDLETWVDLTPKREGFVDKRYTNHKYGDTDPRWPWVE